MKNPDYVRYEQAVKLKRLGFNWKCRYFYESDNKVLMPLEEIVSAIEGHDFCITSDTLMEDFNKQQDICSAPTIAQVQQWLREEKEFEVCACADFECSQPNGKWMAFYRKLSSPAYATDFAAESKDTYEEALSIAIDMVLSKIEEDNK